MIEKYSKGQQIPASVAVELGDTNPTTRVRFPMFDACAKLSTCPAGDKWIRLADIDGRNDPMIGERGIEREEEPLWAREKLLVGS